MPTQKRRVFSVAKIKKLFDLMRKGRTAKAACIAADIKRRTLTDWIRDSRQGVLPQWIAREWDSLVHTKLCCDYCSNMYRRGTGVSREDEYDGSHVNMTFCSQECMDVFYEEEDDDAPVSERVRKPKS